MTEFACYKNFPAYELEISAKWLRKLGQEFGGCSQIWGFLFSFVVFFFFPAASGNPQLPSARPGLWLLLGSSGMSSALMLLCAPECQDCLHPKGPCRVYLCKWQEPIYDSLGNVYVPRCSGLTGSLVVPTVSSVREQSVVG